jgi:integrase
MYIKKFLGNYTKENTVATYRGGIFNFFDSIYGRVRSGRKATKNEIAEYERMAECYFSEERDHFKDMLSFIAAMHDKAPIGARAQINGVIEFLSYHDVEFTLKQRKNLSKKMPKGKTSRTAEKDIDVVMLRRILTHMDLKGKAVTLVLASSGMRPEEPFNVLLSDVDLESAPTELVVRGETSKEGDTRRVFVSSEATEVLLEWLKVRERYLQSAKNRNTGLVKKGIGKEKSVRDQRLFPFTLENYREGWNTALKKAGLLIKDNSTGRSQIRVHGLRKFFRSQLALSCPLDIVEALMGHEGYLTEAYRRYSTKQMGEYYLKAEHHITVMGSGDIREFQDRLQDTQAAVKGYKDIITEQAEEMVDIRRKMEERNGEIAKLREEMETMKRDGHYYQLAYDFLKLLSRDPTTTRRFSEFIDHKKMREKD